MDTPEELKALANAKTDEATWAIAWPPEVFQDDFGCFVGADSSKVSSAEHCTHSEGEGSMVPQMEAMTLHPS